MKFKHTLFFVCLFAAALSLYISQTKREAARVEELKKTSEDFKLQVEEKSPNLKLNQKVNFIQVQELNKDETFWLERQENVWRLTYPIRAMADQAMAQGMAGMVKAAFGQKLLKPEGAWQDYGLDQPEFKIGVGTTGDTERHFLYLGKEAPLKSGVFARWDDKNAYFVLPSAFKPAFRRTVYEMREKRLFLMPLPKIDRIYVEIGEQTFDWTLKNGTWYWMEPIDLIGKKVPDDQVLALIQMLSGFFIKEFVDEKKSVFRPRESV